ncbi:MAG TPA: hypothetical protein VFP87_10410 [Chitinophagaceae bacterium]|nr:hypothetical protein [Chitinophagaceae bacterium]
MRNVKLPILWALLFWTNYSFSQSNAAIAPYISFLNNQTTSAKDYILNLFKNHDIVIVCERNHDEFTQYDLILDIVNDKRFIQTVGNVFTELALAH